MLFIWSTEFFYNQLFQKILSGIPSECQTVWIQIRPDTLSGLILVQTVCKCYQQTTSVGKELISTANVQYHFDKQFQHKLVFFFNLHVILYHFIPHKFDSSHDVMSGSDIMPCIKIDKPVPIVV